MTGPRGRLWPALGVLAAGAVLGGWQTPMPAPAVAVVQPDASAVLRGRVSLEAAVTPSSVPVRSVTFFVDGQQVCRVLDQPYACPFEAGVTPAARSVRVVAELNDGHRLVATRRTNARVAALVFTAAVDAVTVPVRVVDRRGRFVQGLTADRFSLMEDGAPQDVSTILSEDTPTSLVLALDMSASMQNELDELKRAAGAFLDGVRPGDRVSVAAFNSGLFVLARAESDARARRAALDRLRPWGNTALHDSLIRAAELVRTQPAPRAVVAFTDGEDVSSTATVDAVRGAFQANDVALYLVVQGDEPRRDSPGGVLAQVAEETGGGAWYAGHMSDLRDRFSAIVTDLSGRYVLSYTPHKPLGDGGWRQLSVRVVGDDARDFDVRARLGYLAVDRESGTAGR